MATSGVSSRGIVAPCHSSLVLVLVHLPGKINVADILTKAQATSVFVELMAAYDALVSA